MKQSLIESIQNNLNEADELDKYWEENCDRIIKFVDESDPQYIADLIYDGNIDMYYNNTGKQVALDLLHQLGINELEEEMNLREE